MKKKILFIINTMGQAGAETALIELLKKLQTMDDIELFLYVIIPCGELFEKVPRKVKILNKTYSKASLHSFLGHMIIAKELIYSFFYKLTGFKNCKLIIGNIKEQKAKGNKLQWDKLLWRLLAEGRPIRKDTYHMAVAYLEGAATYYLGDKVKAACKAAFVHIDYELAGYSPYMDRDCYKSMDRIYVVSKGVGEKFSKIYPQYRKKIRLFRNLLDRELIVEKADRGIGFTDDFDGIRLVSVGRLHYQKAYDLAIEALAKILNEGYKVRWYVIGEGKERSNLKKLIKKYGVREAFVLLGKKDNPYPYINQADIFVQASRFEGKSIAIEEAQILGKAIIASDCTGNAEQIISGHDGSLFSLNVDNLVREIKKLIDNPILRGQYEKNTKKKNFEDPKDMEDFLYLIRARR